MGHLATEKSQDSLAETYSNLLLAIGFSQESSAPTFPSICSDPLSLTQEKISTHLLRENSTRQVRNKSVTPHRDSNWHGDDSSTTKDFISISSSEPYSCSPKGKQNKYLMSHMQSTVLGKQFHSFHPHQYPQSRCLCSLYHRWGNWGSKRGPIRAGSVQDRKCDKVPRLESPRPSFHCRRVSLPPEPGLLPGLWTTQR